MKIKLLLSSFAFSAALNASLAATPPGTQDPFIWLEQAHSERAMQWVKAANVKTDGVMRRGPRFQTLFHGAKVIVEAKDRITEPEAIAGRLFNFWQDAAHPHGIW